MSFRSLVEIGTSDFGTLHHQFYDDPMWEGVAVEPLAELLEALPLRPGLYAENAAFGCAAMGVEELTLYALDRETVAIRAPHWALGTGTTTTRVEYELSIFPKRHILHPEKRSIYILTSLFTPRGPIRPRGGVGAPLCFTHSASQSQYM